MTVQSAAPGSPRARGWVLRRGERGYPACVEELGELAPERLYGLGEIALVAEADHTRTVTIVGARRSGPYGRGIARELGFGIASAGLVVVSGMALGCDSAAHEGALEAKGTTIAVLGGGPDIGHPPSRAGLHRRILESGGAVIAEHPPGMPPAPDFFPRRNRIMAALAALTIVVEAALRSGTRHTTDRATELGREIGAVPGPVNSAFSELPNGLIKDGAVVIRDVQDVLDEVLDTGAVSARGVGPEIDDPDLEAALRAVEGGAATCDAVANEIPDASAAPVALARLELLGYVRGDSLGRYARTPLAVPGNAEADAVGLRMPRLI